MSAHSSIEQRLLRMEAIHEIQNLVGKYEFYSVAGLPRRCLKLFSLETPGVKVQMDWGIYEGRASVERFFLNYHGGRDAENPEAAGDQGGMHLHTLTTPVIEVAGDLQTARGVWISPGHETLRFGAEGQMTRGPGTLKAFWMWGKYAFDFVLENGRWKIWHMNVFCTFITPYDKSWVEAPALPARPQLPEDLAPDRYFPYPPAWVYSTHGYQVNVPLPPEPYGTFSEAAPFGEYDGPGI